MFFCKPICAPRDPAADTVKIDMPAPDTAAEQAEADRRAAEELQAKLNAEEAEEEARRRAQEEEEEARLRQQLRQEEEEEAQRRAQEREARERVEAEARREREAQAQREREEAEALRRAEAERVQEERKTAVAVFLKQNKFTGAAAPKTTMLAKTYPIHCAAIKGDEQMVRMLLEEGADPAQKNSSGKTAAQVAQKKDSKGSHAGVLRALGGA